MTGENGWGGDDRSSGDKPTFLGNVPDEAFCIMINKLGTQELCGKTPKKCKQALTESGYSRVVGGNIVCGQNCGAVYPQPHKLSCHWASGQSGRPGDLN
jgi:hypothetical protein